MTTTEIEPTVTREPETRAPRWSNPLLAVLLAATALFWTIGLSRNGWANAYYSAAVQAGATSWKAFFFGSSDAGNSITVDKPPASLWPMEISARIFGVNTWSIQVPQVLLGVASVALLYVIVRRHFGPAAGLIAGLVLAVTPVATLMFRYNNPDALLVLLMIAAAWAVTRAFDDGRTRWLVLCGALVGFGFLTKQLQVLLVTPGLALAYLVAGPPRLRTRLLQLGAGLAAMIAAAGWWVVLVQLWPAGSRPYIGGSTDNSFLNLTFGYNGLARLTGERGPQGGLPPMPPGAVPDGAGMPPPGGMFGGRPGLGRLFAGEAAGQIAWLLPAALILLAAGLALRGRTARHDARRAQYLLWGGWVVVTALVFSYMSGIFHEYYTVALAPAIAALIGMGAGELWSRRTSRWARITLAVTVATTAVWAWHLLGRTPQFVPALRWVVLATGSAATVLLIGPLVASARSGTRRVSAVMALAAVAALAGPLAFSVQTVASSHQGGIVTAGPSMRGGSHPAHPGADLHGARPPMGMGGVEGTQSFEEVDTMLSRVVDTYTWVAATNGANEAATFQLATGRPVMPIGGFSSRDPSPTLEQFQRYVADAEIRYYIATPHGPGRFGGGLADPPSTAAEKIASWVRDHYVGTDMAGVVVYDLASPS